MGGRGGGGVGGGGWGGGGLSKGLNLGGGGLPITNLADWRGRVTSLAGITVSTWEPRGAAG